MIKNPVTSPKSLITEITDNVPNDRVIIRHIKNAEKKNLVFIYIVLIGYKIMERDYFLHLSPGLMLKPTIRPKHGRSVLLSTNVFSNLLQFQLSLWLKSRN